MKPTEVHPYFGTMLYRILKSKYSLDNVHVGHKGEYPVSNQHLHLGVLKEKDRFHCDGV